uniref:hypothetical protein n=1 Tax=Cupriavidus yeoncheonensis TaxID=1462994 RepID=UPI003F49403D
MGHLLLLDNDGLLRLAQFGLQLLELLLVPALVLVALILDRLAVVVEGVARVLVFFFE